MMIPEVAVEIDGKSATGCEIEKMEMPSPGESARVSIPDVALNGAGESAQG